MAASLPLLTDAYTEVVKGFEELHKTVFQDVCNDLSTIIVDLSICRDKVTGLIERENNQIVFSVLLQQQETQISFLIERLTNKLQQQKKRILNENISRELVVKKMRLDKDSKNEEISNKEIESMKQVPKMKGLCEIAGLANVKKVLKSLVILPKTQPQLFKDRAISNMVLLYGPPGTGKTRLVHALAAEADATFFSISLSDVLSKYIGDTERCVKKLFEYVKNQNNFSVVFIDEIDGFCRKRTDSEQEHVRRMKTTLMCEMNDIEGSSNLILICATNCPWDLDNAILRRFHKCIYVPLPNRLEREEFINYLISKMDFETPINNWDEILEKTEGHSGADIVHIVQEAANVPLIELDGNLHWIGTDDGFFEPITETGVYSPPDIRVIYCELDNLPANTVKARKATILDVLKAAQDIKATVSEQDINRYTQFHNSK